MLLESFPARQAADTAREHTSEYHSASKKEAPHCTGDLALSHGEPETFPRSPSRLPTFSLARIAFHVQPQPITAKGEGAVIDLSTACLAHVYSFFFCSTGI
jgi:hypothetical protein